jgi:hypothetical protein
MALATAVPETVTERPEALARSASDGKPSAELKGSRVEKGGKDEPSLWGRRGGRKRNASKTSKSAPVARYFLTKAASNGTPELDREVNDENQAMIEALKADRTFAIVTEWRPKVDCSVKGRPVIEKEAISRSAE